MNREDEEDVELGETCYVVECYSATSVDGEQGVGGLVGANHVTPPWPNSIVAASFWDTETSGQRGSADGIGLTTAEMQTATTFLEAGWDFADETQDGTDDIWKIVECQTYPLLSWQKYGGGTGEPNDPYLIYTAEHLNALGAEPNDYDKHFKLMADIDLSGYVYDRAVIAPYLNNDWGVLQGTAFSGSLDGGFHEIGNLTIEGDSYLGLIGRITWYSKIRNLTISRAKITGTGDYIGILGGLDETGRGHWRDPDPGQIANCSVSGTVQGRDYVGGLLGSSGVSIEECSVNADVYGRKLRRGIVWRIAYTQLQCTLSNSRFVHQR